jgi:ABC-type transport system substrate-binding protein
MKLSIAVSRLSLLSIMGFSPVQSNQGVPISSIMDDIAATPNEACNNLEVTFIVQDNNPEMQAVEDDIRANLAQIGIKVKTMFLNDTEYRDAEVNGDYHLLFTRTWGAPYDPHSYMASWAVPSHVEYTAIGNMTVSILSSIENIYTKSALLSHYHGMTHLMTSHPSLAKTSSSASKVCKLS